MQPDVTFLVAAFNAADTIGRAIDSALRQIGVTVEVVVVDDASTDATFAAVASVADERVRVRRLEGNKGPGGARNAGLSMARGRYVAVLDADDTVRPDRMARLVARLDASGGAAVVDGIEVRARDGTTFPMFAKGELGCVPTLGFPDFALANRLFAGRHNFGYLKPTVRRGFLDETGIVYPETVRIGEDYQFLAEILLRGGVCMTDGEIGYTYQISERSVSRVLTLADVEAIERNDAVFIAGYELDPSAQSAQRLRSASIVRAHAFLTMVDALKRGDYGTAARSAVRHPRALVHFQMPIAKRFNDRFQRTARLRSSSLLAMVQRSAGGE